MQNNSNRHNSIYESIFGVQAYSIKGPLLYFALGVISSVIFVFLYILGVYIPGVTKETDRLRPDLTFPFIGFIMILALSSAVIGIILGVIGLIWRKMKQN